MPSKILVLDDDNQIVEALGIILRSSGYEAILVSDPSGIEARVEQEMPDLLIFDIRLYNVSGLDITRNLKNNPKTAHIPIILISARVGNLDESQRQGAELYLPKPFRMKELLNAVSAMLTQ